ncbi:GNAT family N-acetyltransferase [Kitasatospora sp. NPDC048296]|uniref:GNAT family N-acetyltransferase n=1 Tax=Kitasatospora sp. NPDC048296 TaxID=3364048 RepID=UPI00371BF839
MGWVDQPTAACERWLDTVLRESACGNAALCVAHVDGEIRGLGTWRRDHEPILSHRAEISKVMAHPGAQGMGLGRAATTALVERARATGLEHLRLRVRGNNHAAAALYEALGFHEYARLRTPSPSGTRASTRCGCTSL